MDWQETTKYIDSLNSENGRLREALEGIRVAVDDADRSYANRMFRIDNILESIEALKEDSPTPAK